MSNQQNFKYKRLALGVALILIIVFTGIAIYLIPQYAYLYVGFTWLAFASLIVKYSKTEKGRLIGIYTGSVILAFSLAEVYFTYQYFDQDFYEVESIYGGHNYTHEVLGTAPTPDSQWKSKLYNLDTLVYDVINTIDSHGFRSSPQQDTIGQNAVLFFGCSFTFGLGLNDDETLPHYFHLTAPAQWHSYNMGYNGYGVHHTLAMLQNRMEMSVLQGKQPKAAFYSAITHHVFRGTGRIINNDGPRYKLTPPGHVVPRLTKALDGRENVHRVKWLLSKSFLFDRLFFSNARFQQQEVDLFVGMIKEAADIFSKRYKAPFYCLLWEEPYAQSGLYETLLKELKAQNIRVIEVDQFLPDFRQHPQNYIIDKEGHPNAMANKHIASYLNSILNP